VEAARVNESSIGRLQGNRRSAPKQKE